MKILSYGYQLPETGDKGEKAFLPLEQNIQQLNDHSHNGEDSAVLSGSNIGSVQIQVPSSNWASYPGAPIGFLRQVVEMAPGFAFDLKNAQFRDASGHYVYPSVERIDQNSFYVYSIDPTLSLVANYGG